MMVENPIDSFHSFILYFIRDSFRQKFTLFGDRNCIALLLFLSPSYDVHDLFICVYCTINIHSKAVFVHLTIDLSSKTVYRIQVRTTNLHVHLETLFYNCIITAHTKATVLFPTTLTAYFLSLSDQN